MKQRLAVFGSTGSIGVSTLALAAAFPERLDVVALTAGRNIEKLREQIRAFHPRVVVVDQEADALTLGREFPGIEFLHGAQGLLECARWDGLDIACQGIVGFAALAPTLELVRKKRKIALANKETLVVAGALLREEMRQSGAVCIPVDSEHNALFQLLLGKDVGTVESLVLTASGGPFWNRPELDTKTITPEQAIAHPKWKMGPKISVDSATMMNKGLEIVETHFLFDIEPERIEVWVHPQSIVHGAVWFSDGTCQAQLCRPDMKASISFALAYPDRMPGAVKKLSMAEFSRLEFHAPDTVRFPALELPRQALAAGSSHLVALNAANEVAVAAFLSRELGFSAIAEVLRELLDRHVAVAVESVESISAVDRVSREKTREIISNWGSRRPQN